MTVENILTIDLEDWYHICGVEDVLPEASWPYLESRVTENTRKILNILFQKHTRATFFILGCIAERHPELIAEIQSAGHEIATHGYGHRQVYTMTPESFREDIKKAVRILTDITGNPVTGYRAPEWSIRDDSLWALTVLQQEGFRYDSSMAPLPVIGNQTYGRLPYKLDLDKGPLWEFPPLVAVTPFVNLPLGGGWGLRVFPYTLIRSTIQKHNSQGEPAVIYLHPREFDRNNPRTRLPLAKRFVVGGRIERTETRLARLLDDFRFTTISQVLEKKKFAIRKFHMYKSRLSR